MKSETAWGVIPELLLCGIEPKVRNWDLDKDGLYEPEGDADVVLEVFVTRQPESKRRVDYEQIATKHGRTVQFAQAASGHNHLGRMR